VRLFSKYTGLFKRIKAFYLIHNLLNYNVLKNNRRLYKKYGVKRFVWQSISSKYFPVDVRNSSSTVNEEWDNNGFVILPKFISEELVNQINEGIENALNQKVIDFNFTQKKILFAYEKVPVLKEVINHPKVTSKLEELIGEEVIPFQSINFLKGSEQAAHSDSVHMGTYPLGGLIAIWVALEDIDEQNGGLFYYPGSHKLPYATNEMVGNKTGAILSPNPNQNYEDYVQGQIENRDLAKQHFIAQKGDVLIWHANLLHGGLLHVDSSRSRKSMVVHYFVKDRICYHELSQRPAIVNQI
jgi:hypothetical protein